MTKEELVQEVNRRLLAAVDEMAEQNGITREELLGYAKNLLEEAHRNKERARIKEHGLKFKGDEE